MIKNQYVEELRALLGTEKVVVDEDQLRVYDGFNRYHEKAFDLCMTVPPIAIVFAESVNDVVKALKFCSEKKLNLIARAGASSAEGLLEAHEESLVLDVGKMNKLIKIDKHNMIATVQSGFPLQRLEDEVNALGLTTGHSPQSRPMAFMGGLVATNSIGQFSTYYGGIADMVSSLEAVMPDGTVIRTRDVPRRSAGPDLNHLFIGSEGAIGVITEVTVKLFPYYPNEMWMGGYIVDDMETGFKAVRDIMTEGYKPSVLRLYDKEDFDRSFGSVELREGEAFMFFTAEGPATVAAATGEGVDSIARRYNARYIGTEGVEHWLEHRNDLCVYITSGEFYRRARETGIMDGTLEVSANWSDIVQIYHNIIENVPKKIDNLVFLGGHASHAYVNGVNLYFVYSLRIDDPKNSDDEQRRFIRAVCDEVIKMPSGGVVHHHGMGKQRVCYAEREHGSAYILMRKLKDAFDPDGIMNRGNLIQKY